MSQQLWRVKEPSLLETMSSPVIGNGDSRQVAEKIAQAALSNKIAKLTVSNVIRIQKANTKSSAGQHAPPTNTRIGSGAYEESHKQTNKQYHLHS
jgi:hypothetical protein